LNSDIYGTSTSSSLSLSSPLCTEYNIPFLGCVPLDPRLGKCCEDGVGFQEVVDAEGTGNVDETWAAVEKVCQGVLERLKL